MNRYELLNLLQETIKDELVVCNIGLPSQELYKINDQPNYHGDENLRQLHYPFMTDIQFINHASVLVNCNEVALLSDPWYQGDAFHKGWNLVYELNDEQIVEIASGEINRAVSKYMPNISLVEFYSQRKDLLGKSKENSSNNIAHEFLSNQARQLNFENQKLNEINTDNKDLDSLYEITIKYTIPLLNKTKQITLTINSSK